MKDVCFLCVLHSLMIASLFAQTVPSSSVNWAKAADTNSSKQPDKAKILGRYGKLPLNFEENYGQADAQVRFLSRMSGYTLFLTQSEVVFSFGEGKVDSQHLGSPDPNPAQPPKVVKAPRTRILRMRFFGANPKPDMTGLDELPGSSNYFVGSDPKLWHRNVATYSKVKYQGIYSGIDLVYYGNQRQLEYDLIIAPGIDSHCISFDIRGAKRIRMGGKSGDLILEMAETQVRWHKPLAYQERNGRRLEVSAAYKVDSANRVRFKIGNYDRSRPLYIDPVIYSTFLGGNGSDIGSGIVVDNAGSVYVTGTTASTDFPSVNSRQPNYGGGSTDAFVSKLSPDGSSLIYSTFLGGNAADVGNGIAVDSEGNAYITGYTESPDFPTQSAFKSTYGGGIDAFVTKIGSTGSDLIYSSFLGGSEQDCGTAIAVDRLNSAYVTGFTRSTDFPTMNPFQSSYGAGSSNAFVTKIAPAGSTIVYSTYLGGSTGDAGSGIAVDGENHAYITGTTFSTDFPTKNPLQSTSGGVADAFVTKLDPTGSTLSYSTYLGGSGDDIGVGIALDSNENVYVTGGTDSQDFPIAGALQPVLGGSVDVFVSKINPKGSALVYSTFLGGGAQEDGEGIAVDGNGDAYVVGFTDSNDFPLELPLHNHFGGKTDAFIFELNPAGSALIFSTYFGARGPEVGMSIAVDRLANIYITGTTSSKNFPVTPGAFQTLCNDNVDCSNGDAFVTKLSYPITATSLISSENPSVSGKLVTFTATVSASTGITAAGKLTFLNGTTVLATKLLSRGATRFSLSTLPAGTNEITATYSDGSNFLPSTSLPLEQVVLSATTTTMTSSPNPSTAGQLVTFTASVNSALGPPPDGEIVAFMKGTQVLGTVELTKGSAIFRTSALPVATSLIHAVYGGDSGLATSTSKIVRQVVKKAL